MPVKKTNEEVQKVKDQADRNVASHSLNSPKPPFRLFEFPIHPLLIAAFPIFSLYAANLDQVELQEIGRPLGISILATGVIWGLFSLVSRNINKSALAASALSLAFFSYGHVLNQFPVELKGWALPIHLSVLATALALICLYKSRSASQTLVFNLAAFVLIAPSSFQIVKSLAEGSAEVEQSVRLNKELVSSVKKSGKAISLKPLIGKYAKGGASAHAAKQPDIYYIILDAYGRADSLKYFHGTNNEPFVRELEKRGFYLPRLSRSNYAQTGYALPTSLNMNYLDTLLEGRNPSGDLIEELRSKIDNNEVASFLRKKGYQYVAIWSGTKLSNAKTADLELEDDSLAPPASFENQVFGLSVFDAAPQSRLTAYDNHRAFILNAFHNLNTVAKLPFSKFVFAHISAPHPPFVFDANGGAVYPPYRYNEDDGSNLLKLISREEYKSGYYAQLQYINRRTLECVDAILRQSAQPPVIIIQGDHGSRMNLNWESMEKTDLREPFSILNAYYVPPKVRSRLYETITPVNSFRMTLSELFGANYPQIPDRSFFSLPAKPLDFIDVTKMIRPFPTNAKVETVRSDSMEERAKK